MSWFFVFIFFNMMMNCSIMYVLMERISKGFGQDYLIGAGLGMISCITCYNMAIN